VPVASGIFSPYDKNILTSPIQGLGKLSKKYLYRLISRTITCSDGVIRPGASSCEILTVIYLSQIADKKGFIRQFRIRELAKTIGFTEREVYFALDNLIKKEYITASYYQNRKWTGYRNITLKDNDFSKSKYSKDNRYLNTFFSFFNWTTSNATMLRDLSLYTLRLLLLILFQYHPKNGANINRGVACELLGIKNPALISKYLKEIGEKVVIDDGFYKEVGDKKSASGYIHFRSKNMDFVPEKRPADNQLSFYKRKWLLYLRANRYSIRDIVTHYIYKTTLMDFLNSIFSKVYFYLQEGYELRKIEGIIKTVIKEHEYIVDVGLISHISLRLEKNLAQAGS